MAVLAALVGGEEITGPNVWVWVLWRWRVAVACIQREASNYGTGN